MNACARWNSPERARCERSPEIATTSNRRSWMIVSIASICSGTVGSPEVEIGDVKHRHIVALPVTARRAMMASVNCASSRCRQGRASRSCRSRITLSIASRMRCARVVVARVLEHEARRVARARRDSRCPSPRCRAPCRAPPRRSPRSSPMFAPGARPSPPTSPEIEIRENVAEEIRGDDDVEHLGLDDELHRHGVDDALIVLDAPGELLRDLAPDLAKQAARASSGCSPCGRASLSSGRAPWRTRTRSG